MAGTVRGGGGGGGAWVMASGHERKSGAALTRSCFLWAAMVVVVMMVTVLKETSALTTPLRQPDPAMGLVNVKFRGVRSAFMHPTATSFSPPNKNNNNNAGRRSMSLGGGSITSSLMPPGVASHAPATRTLDTGPAAPALTPPPHGQRPHTWASGAGSHPQQPTFVGFGLDGASAPRPEKWSRPRASATAREASGGWAGMEGPAVQERQAWSPGVGHPRAQFTAGLSSSLAVTEHGRPDTFGVDITEDLSHLNNRPSGRWNTSPKGRYSGGSEGMTRGRGSSRSVFGGGYRQSRWPADEEDEGEDMVMDSEDVRSVFGLNTTTEYQTEDYETYHNYDQSNHSWKSSENTSSSAHDRETLTYNNVMEIMNLASQADLHALLEQKGITFDELRDFLNSGARKKDVLEFLKPSPPLSSFISTTTTTTSPELPQRSPDSSVVEEGYQARERAFSTEADHEGQTDAGREAKEEAKRGRKKPRRGKGGRRRKNKKRKGKKGQKEDPPEADPSPIPPMDNTTPNAHTELWIPSTPRTLLEVSLATTAEAIEDTMLPTTEPLTPDTIVTPPPSVRTSEVSIVSVTLVEASSDPHHVNPAHTTLVEDAMHTRRHNTHNTTRPWEDRTPRKFPRPTRPSREPEQTVNEVEKINFVREEQREDYVFPLRGLLIISGLMGALAVFTLVVLISYAVIKCSKKPVVNNYQVSEQQKPAGT